MNPAPSTASLRRPALEAAPGAAPGARPAESSPDRDPSSPCPARQHRGAAIRRAFDILVSATALLLLIPVFVLVAVLIRATSRGPILYSQIRVGHNRRDSERRSWEGATGPADRRAGRDRRRDQAHGRPFRIWKFRTMVVNAEEYGPRWSSRGDPRITPIGQLLRLTRLDETPQFWNVLRGEMSLVGPRPERPYFVDQFAESIPRYPRRFAVPPGITGQAQVNLSYDADLDDVKRKLEQDLDYVSERSLKRDCGILLKTIRVVLTGKGAC